MAALIFELARSTRDEAQRLRSDSDQLRLAMRATARVTEARKARASAEMAVTRARRAIPVASPWSGLAWLREDESLERILLPVD